MHHPNYSALLSTWKKLGYVRSYNGLLRTTPYLGLASLPVIGVDARGPHVSDNGACYCHVRVCA